jgi:ketosteroid isomerase-like protein
MHIPRILSAISLSLAAVLITAAQNPSQSDAKKYIEKSESAWAEAGSKGDAATIKRILADDFIGIAPDGSRYDKAKEIADTANNHGNTISNHLNEVTVRFFGETAVAQGSETWERREGPQKHGTYVWTDTWIHRNNTWQIVAAEDLLRPDSAPK